MATQLDQPLGRAPDTAGAVDVHYGEDSTRKVLVDSWRHLHVIPQLGLRLLVKGLSGTFLGPFWMIVGPILSIFGMGLLFGTIFRAPSNGIPYLIFLLGGALGWRVFDRTAFWGTRSFDVFRRIARNVYLPPVVLPSAAIFMALVELLGIGLVFIGTVVAYIFIDGVFYLQAGPQLLLVPLGMALAGALGWSVALWTGTLNARARDVRILFRYVLMIWMYITPVLFPPRALPDVLQPLAVINPVAAPVEIVKEGLLGVGEIQATGVLISLLFLLVVGGGGTWFCARFAPRFLRARMAYDDDEEEDF
jgi:ABC-type polysaccharide/polyol phosphate export permease